MSNQSNQTPDITRIVALALTEDIGSGDITSQLLIPENAQAEMQFVARQDMIACGMFVAEKVFQTIDPQVTVEVRAKEGQRVGANTVLAMAKGKARSLLAGERVALNLMQRACGVATLTAAYVEAVRGTKAVILDTRKTMPGMRALDKYAVCAGGGQNHRMGLYDMVLVKDNHIALCGGVGEAVKKTKGKGLPVIVECDTLEQVKEALAAKPDRILLDNMDTKTLRAAAQLAAGKIPLEASGAVSLGTVRAIADTGVDYISVGALTHSAKAADIGADIKIKH